MSVDFEAEGLLEGTAGKAREGRLRLLGELHADGVPLAELRTAVKEQRLVLLPVERVLAGGDPPYTMVEIAERADVPLDYLARQRQALGLPIEDPSEAVGTDDDLASAKRVRLLLDAGLPADGIIEVSRVIGIAMSQVAAANRTLVADALVRDGDTEYELAKRLAGAAAEMMPLVGETLAHALRVHVREQVRHDVLAAGDPEAGTEVSACFADLVGFTRLGERLPVEELGAVTGRLDELAAGVAVGPVRLVKLIGDGAMLVSPDNDALLEAAIEMVESAEQVPDESFPQIRAGIARGRAVARGGDWYGAPVNQASRITGIAYPGSVLASAQAKDAAVGDFRFSFAGERKLRGVRQPVGLFRVRRAE